MEQTHVEGFVRIQLLVGAEPARLHAMTPSGILTWVIGP